MKSWLGSLVLCVMMSLIVCNSSVYADGSLDGKWKIHIEVLNGSNRGMQSDYIMEITQDITNGRIDGKTVDDSDKQIGRVSGLIKRTIVELAFSFEDDRAMTTMHLSADGTMMGGIFRLRNGGEGVVYCLKKGN